LSRPRQKLPGLVAGMMRRPWWILGMMELGIAALAIPVALLPWWTAWLWPALGQDALAGPAGGWVKLAVSLACVLPPSFCMGFFIPVAAHEISRGVNDRGGRALGLYAANTLGGVAGLAVTAGWLIHAFGFLGAMIAAMLANIAVAAGCFWLGRRGGDAPQHVDAAVEIARHPGTGMALSRRGCQALAFFSGMAVLAVEVLLVLLLGLAIPVSFYGPAAMLAVVIFALAVAAGLAALPWCRRRDPAQLVVGVLVVAALLLVVSPWWFHGLASGLPSLVKAGSAAGFIGKLTILISLSFGLAMVAAGLVFPLVALAAERHPNDDGARAWGGLLAWNGLGALAGAELSYRFLLPAAGLHAAFAWVACGYAVVAVIVALRLRSLPGAAAGVAAAACCALLAVPWLDRLPVVNPHVGLKTHEVLAGREGIVAVVEHPALGKAILLSNQYLLGSTSARWSQERQAHLPMLLHPLPRRAGFLGVATGNTPAAALAHTAVEAVDAVEISPLMVDAARRHFAVINAPLFADARARVVVEDGRTWFAASPGRYDVIAGDLFQPWGPGEGRLFSIEHFRAVREALADGGVFCQWLPGHQLSAAEFDSITASFIEVFGSAELFADGFSPQAPSIALVGWKNGSLDWQAAATRCDHERRAGGIMDPLMRHGDGLQLLHLASISKPPANAIANTLNNNRVELSAGRRQIRGAGQSGTLHGGAWLAWLRENASQPPLATRLREAEHHAYSRREPLATSTSGRTLWAELPAAITSDTGADWNRWPGTLRPRH